MKRLLTGALALFCLCGLARADEAQIRKNLTTRMPSMPTIDEISRTPMNGLYEVRMGSEVMYTDAEGQFLIQGSLFDVRNRRNLTEERVEKLSQVGFDQLPLKNAFTQVRGNGQRKLVVFADPNCGYCKRFERELQTLNNVTLYHVLYPILGDDSIMKARNIWCSRDRARTWNQWMQEGRTPPSASCDAGLLQANVEFGRKYRITGTPTLFFADGTRVVGAVSMAQIEKTFAQVR